MREPLLYAWADSRPRVGAGHVVRTFALAQAWVDHGGRAVLCVHDLAGTIGALTNDPRIERLVVPVHEAPFDAGGGAAFAARAVDAGAAWVSVDSYDTSAAAQAVLRARGLRVAVIDDQLLAAPYDADLLVDQNLGAERRTAPLPGRVDHACLGVRHTLLRRAFRVRDDAAPRPRRDRVVVTLGGNPTPELASWGCEVARLVAAHAPVDLVLGGALSNGAECAGVTVHGLVLDASSMFSSAAVAVSAAGSTAWELCASGTPSVLVAVAGNQVPVGDELAAAGAARFVGPIAPTAASAPEAIAASVLDLLHDVDARAEMAAQGRALVDGQGASRVVAAMRAVDLRLRPATDTDVERYFLWANDPDVRAASFTSDPIAWDEHVRWFAERLAHDRTWMYVAEHADGTPVGQIRFDAADGSVRVGVSLAADARGQGLAAPVIVAGVRALRAEVPQLRCVHAEVRTTNEASARAFRAAGFERRARVEHPRPGVGEIDVFVRDARRCS